METLSENLTDLILVCRCCMPGVAVVSVIPEGNKGEDKDDVVDGGRIFMIDTIYQTTMRRIELSK